jgi:four helix bundle protein
MKIKSFTDLYAWQKGHELAKQVYKNTYDFPAEEKFGLVSQIRRSALSVTSNIAEGFSRSSAKEKARYYEISLGSIYELQNQILLARDLKFLSQFNFSRISSLSVETAKLINSLKRGILDSNF